MNMRLLYPNDSKLYLMDYANASYILNYHNVIMVDHKI